jgi:tripartite-type tricarboxylate transporter receptor subunit TctC
MLAGGNVHTGDQTLPEVRRTKGLPTNTLRVIRSILTLLACTCVSPMLQAQDNYPSKTIRIIVPFAAGGPGDIIARAFAVALSNDLGQTVIVDNRPGADGAIGTQQAALAASDGYTILQVASTQIINMALKDKEKLHYDLLSDFIPVARTVQNSMVLVTPLSLPVRSVADLVALAKSKPNGLVYGSGATGSVGHLSAEMFKRAARISALHVPYKGTGAAMADLVGGRLDFFFLTQFEAIGAVKGGHVFPLAVTANKRTTGFPDTPTMIELGFSGFDSKVSYGYMVPLKTSAHIVQQIQDAVLRSITAPNVQSAMQTLGATSFPGGPNELTATVKSELETWSRVIRTENVRVD